MKTENERSSANSHLQNELKVVESNEAARELVTDLKVCEMRLIYFLISLVSQEDTEFRRIRLGKETLAQIIFPSDEKSARGRGKEIAAIMDSLAKAQWCINDALSTQYWAWFSYASLQYTDATHSLIDYCDFKFNPMLARHLLNLQKNFSQMQYCYLSQLSRVCSFKLYEVLSSYLYLGQKEIGVDDLRRKLKLLDGANDLYPEYKRFNAKVLAPCIAEINEKTNLIVSYEAVRDSENGHKIAAVRFDVKTKAQEPLVAYQFNVDRQTCIGEFEGPDGITSEVYQVVSVEKTANNNDCVKEKTA